MLLLLKGFVVRACVCVSTGLLGGRGLASFEIVFWCAVAGWLWGGVVILPCDPGVSFFKWSMVVCCASFSSSAFSLVHQRLSFVLFYVLVVLVLIRESDFLSAWEFVWSCGKCGWCFLSCLWSGSSLLSPVISPLPWSVWWFSCGYLSSCFSSVVRLDFSG